MRLKPTLVLMPSGFLYDRRDAESYTLNPTAQCIVEALTEPRTIPEITTVLSERFDIDEQRAGRDAARFLAELRALGLLVFATAGDRQEV